METYYRQLMLSSDHYDSMDQDILGSLGPVASELEGKEGSIVTWAIVAMEYLAPDGTRCHGWRKVGCSDFEVGGVIKMLEGHLTASYVVSTTMEEYGIGDEDDEEDEG